MKYLALASVLLVAASPSTFVWSTSTVKTLAPGVTLTQDMQSNPALLVDVLTVNPAVDGVSVAPAVSNDSLTDGTGDIRKGRENVSSLVARKKLPAAVNGDYFPFTGDPLGFGVMDGEIYSEPFSSATVPGRAAIGWLSAGKAIVGIPHLDASLREATGGASYKITGIDRLTSTTDPNDLVLSTPRFGPTSASRGEGTDIVLSDASPLPVGPGSTITATVTAVVTGDPLPVTIPAGGLVVSAPAEGALAAALAARFHVGDQVVLSIRITDIMPSSVGTLGGSWNDVRQAIGGGPILLKDGNIVVDGAAEGFDTAFTDTPHSRTAVGVRSDGTVVIVTVDDASALSSGITLENLAALLQSFGVVDAINLDGGGSTTMVADGQTVDYPSGSDYERPVADMLTVRASMQTAIRNADSAAIIVPTQPVIVGSSETLGIDDGNQPISGKASDVVWNGPVGDIGFVTQDGVFHAYRAGHATVSAVVSGEPATAQIDVVAPVPAQAPNPAAPSASPVEPPPGAPDASAGLR